jgi:heme-binding NEAT domain protein
MTRASDWARDYLRDHPAVVTVRLGLGYDELTGNVSAWIDLIYLDGGHAAANSSSTLPVIPKDVANDLRAILHTGGSLDVERENT